MLDINKIVTFAENGVEKFIEEHPSLTFYSFALGIYKQRYPENYTSKIFKI
jgi:hypothetical protein